jgi:hypothetical protein
LSKKIATLVLIIAIKILKVIFAISVTNQVGEGEKKAKEKRTK